jgi:sialate O-acetylesterase
LPANALRAGDNVLVVKVDDSGGNGGPNGPANALKLQTSTGDVALAGNWKYRLGEIGASSAAGAMGPNDYPTLLYNAMINPLIPYTLRGAIWYQGESNATRAFQYRKSFPLMITDWRTRWGQGDFPFYFVQLASFFAGSGGNKNSGNEWAELREAQTMTLSLPNTGMAVTTDIGNPKDIHPKNKQEVGRRLALQALANTYGQSALVANGPVLTQAMPQGGKMMLSFANTAGGLVANDKYGYLLGFELAGADKQWYPAKAWIEGDKVVAFTEAVPQPVAVRYGWTDDASEINLFNKAGLPAGPFRTDSWERSTEGRKFREK